MLLQNGTHYTTVCYKMVRLQNGNRHKTVRVTKRYVTKRYVLQNGTLQRVSYRKWYFSKILRVFKFENFLCCPVCILPLYRARALQHLLEAEQSTFQEELSFKGQRFQTGSNRFKQGGLCKWNKRIKLGPNDSISVFFIQNISRLIRKPYNYYFSPVVILKCLRIRAQDRVFHCVWAYAKVQWGDFATCTIM